MYIKNLQIELRVKKTFFFIGPFNPYLSGGMDLLRAVYEIQHLHILCNKLQNNNFFIHFN